MNKDEYVANLMRMGLKLDDSEFLVQNLIKECLSIIDRAENTHDLDELRSLVHELAGVAGNLFNRRIDNVLENMRHKSTVESHHASFSIIKFELL